MRRWDAGWTTKKQSELYSSWVLGAGSSGLVLGAVAGSWVRGCRLGGGWERGVAAGRWVRWLWAAQVPFPRTLAYIGFGMSSPFTRTSRSHGRMIVLSVASA